MAFPGFSNTRRGLPACGPAHHPARRKPDEHPHIASRAAAILRSQAALLRVILESHDDGAVVHLAVAGRLELLEQLPMELRKRRLRAVCGGGGEDEADIFQML